MHYSILSDRMTCQLGSNSGRHGSNQSHTDAACCHLRPFDNIDASHFDEYRNINEQMFIVTVFLKNTWTATHCTPGEQKITTSKSCAVGTDYPTIRKVAGFANKT